MSLKTYLIVTGIGTFVALAMPWVVVIASFLIIPGLILVMMPTAFLYGLVFATLRLLLGNYASGVSLNLLAAVATLALLWIIPQPGLLWAKGTLASLKQPDILPTAAIRLSGDVRITRPFESRCDQLCAALLKTPGVTSVRIETEHGYSYTYRIVDASTPGPRGDVIGHGLVEERRQEPGDPLADRRALEAEWNLMLAGGKALLRSDQAPSPDITIAIEDGPALRGDQRRPERGDDWSFKPSQPRRKALTIIDAQGEPLLRQSILSIFAPRAPLLIGVSGGIENFRFGWERKRFGDGRLYAEIPVERLLLDHTSIARGVDRKASATKARGELVRALDDPARPTSDQAFALANQWMESFRATTGPLYDSDRQLLARVFSDRRVQSSDGLYAIVKRVQDDPTDLRRLAAQRYLQASDKKAARGWINPLANLPAGAFAVPLPEERQILSDPAISHFATGLIQRQADRGVDAVPDLLRMLREYSLFDPGKYGFSDLTEGINAVRSAFRRIGPAASFARPEIEELLASPGLEYRYRKLGKDDWDTLLVVLGRPVETLRKPEASSGTDASYRQRIAERAAKPFTH